MFSNEVFGETVSNFDSRDSQHVLQTAAESWSANSFAEVDGVVQPEWLHWFSATVYPSLLRVAETQNIPAVMDDSGRPGGGQRLKRVDPERPGIPEADVSRMLKVYEQYNLHDLGERLSDGISPIVEKVLGAPVKYSRIYFLLYGLDDYISPHDDQQTGPRLNVQLPICTNGIAGLRVYDGDWVTYPDRAGTLRFLGPGVWHEVLPLIGAPDASRLNITLRYWLQ